MDKRRWKIVITDDMAKNIIRDMKEIIKQDLNFVDKDGHIIASTDEMREGAYHQAGEIVARTGRDLMVEFDGQYKGSKKGINMPVYLNGEIVGVIGIRGDEDQVVHYGKIILKMTEILVKDAYIKDVRIVERDNNRMVIQELLSKDMDYDKIKKFKVKTSQSRLVIVSKLLDLGGINGEMENKLYHLYRKSIQDEDAYISRVNESTVVIIPSHNRAMIGSLLDHIYGQVHRSYGARTIFGIGSEFKDIKDARSSYEDGKLALDFLDFEFRAIKNPDYYRFYIDLDIELILDSLSRLGPEKFVKRVLGGLDGEEISYFHRLISSYARHNGSINLIGKDLYLHKNTIQYNIKKVYEKTGYDMRKYDDFLILRLAQLLSCYK